MPTPGYVFKDGGPIPDNELNIQQTAVSALSESTARDVQQDITRPSTSNSSNSNTPTSSASFSNLPTGSHALANAEHEEQGAAQVRSSEAEVKNLGWFDDPQNMPPLVGGLPNEELWTLIRRFNKQMYHVKAISNPPPGDLDLNIADEEEFSPEKLRSNFERLYMTVIIGFLNFGKHIARLRSWREPRRSSIFCVVGYVTPVDFSSQRTWPIGLFSSMDI